jgi:hypothetical protein
MRAVVGADALDISASKLVSVSDGLAFAMLRQSQRANAGELRLVLRSGARCGSHNVFAPTHYLQAGWRRAERDVRVLPALNGISLSLFRLQTCNRSALPLFAADQRWRRQVMLQQRWRYARKLVTA